MERATFYIHSEEDTLLLGEKLATHLRPGDVIGFKGDLGAGKTFLVGAIAHALGIPESTPVPSPTFTLIREYVASIPIYHMDLYRLGHPSEIYDLGLWEYYEGSGVCLVEWCDRFSDLWPSRALVLTISLGEGECRVIRAEGEERAAEIIGSLRRDWTELGR